MQRHAGDGDRRLQRFDDALRDRGGVRLFRRRRQQQHELVAAHARDGVDLADHAAQSQRDAIQQLVAGVMAERIVDELEAIQVEHQHGELLAIAFRVHDRLVEAVIEQHAIGKSGQGIVRGDVSQLVVGGFQAHGAHRDHVFERMDLAAQHLLVVPLARERAGALQDLDGLEGLLEHQ